LTALVALFLARSHRIPSMTNLQHSLRSISISQLFLGVFCIYAGLFLRAIRWALLMPPEGRPRPMSLIAPQFAGFAAVALFGRVADLTRPYFVAKRTHSPLAMQIAVYSIERAFDLAATAVLFSVTLLFVPRSAPHHEAFSRAGILSAAATAFLLLFALLVRSAGHHLARSLRTHVLRSAPKLANALAERILELQAGFTTLRSAGQLVAAFAWSLLIWFGIALAYLFSAHALPGTPQLANLGLAAIMLLMATSMGASLLQLPIVGWFTQIAALAAAFHGIFGVPAGPASVCGLLTFAVNTLSVIPTGLLLARWSGLSLREGRHAATVEPA
jgi:hypothetical protein